jgi:uncharacterized protein (TIGR02466 family)
MTKNTKPIVENGNEFSVEYYFPTAIYTIMKPEYLAIAKKVCKEYVAKAKIDDLQKAKMTNGFQNDERITELSNKILNYSWDILDSQGYDMSNYRTYFDEFWCHDYEKFGSMDQHTHGRGSQLVGFYFVNCPKDCSKSLFYDPKIAKVQINLPEKNDKIVSYASNVINIQPKEGMLLITNSWLAHAFTRNASNKNMQFIHFTVTPYQNNNFYASSSAEVI